MEAIFLLGHHILFEATKFFVPAIDDYPGQPGQLWVDLISRRESLDCYVLQPTTYSQRKNFFIDLEFGGFKKFFNHHGLSNE